MNNEEKTTELKARINALNLAIEAVSVAESEHTLNELEKMKEEAVEELKQIDRRHIFEYKIIPNGLTDRLYLVQLSSYRFVLASYYGEGLEMFRSWTKDAVFDPALLSKKFTVEELEKYIQDSFNRKVTVKELENE